MENKDFKDTDAGEKKKEESSSPFDLSSVFKTFAAFGDKASEGASITLKNIDKWLKQAGILDGKKITDADTAITFSKIAKSEKRIDLNKFEQFLEQLASDKKMEKEEIISKLLEASEPALSDVTKPITSGAAGANLERMTDTSQYTGSHRERFDESGQGKGREGREDTDKDDGYVTGFSRKK